MMAGESVLAGYARQILNDYGILLVWEDLPIEERAKEYIQANINMADLEVFGTNFMKTNLIEVCSNNKKYVTDDGGEFFTNQILSYMKYEGVKDAVNLLTKNTEVIKNNENNEIDTSEVEKIVDENHEELQEIISEIDDNIENLNDAIDLEELFTETQILFKDVKENISSTNKKDKKNRIKLIKKFHVLENVLSERNELSERTISLIEKYQKEKEKILGTLKTSYDGIDYIEENLAKLKNVKDKIEENEQLSVSKMSDVSSENIGQIERSENNIDQVIEILKNLNINEVTKKDEENKSLYEKALALVQDGALSLVVEDVSSLSKNTIKDSDLPSNKMSKKENNALKKIQDKALMILYINDKFGCYTLKEKDTVLLYEFEYILGGANNDKDNFFNTVEQLVLLRNITDAAYLLTDVEKMSEISTVAMSAAAALAMPFLEPVIKAVLVEAWALVEAISDVKALLANKKVAVVKTKSTWRTDLYNLSSDKQGDENGLTYKNYCELLMMLLDNDKLIYRTMDLIQVNIRKRYNDSFRMNRCLTKVDITATYEAEPLFSAMPWCVALLSSDRQAYQFDVIYKNEY